MPNTVLVLGACSDIGRSIARRYADSGACVILAARDAVNLARDLTDLQVRLGPDGKNRISSVHCDIVSTDPRSFFDGLLPMPDTVVCVVGLLGDAQACERDHEAATRVIEANYLGPARFLNEAAARLTKQGSGAIVGISSVAGDRGRASNYIYGSSKAGFTAFLSGLRNRLFKSGVHVLTVKPGFVATKMTAGMKLPARLTAQPDEVAAVVVNGVLQRRDVVYVRPVWRWIMLVIGLIPEKVFKRLSL
jgi:decaprenylphospho-beta-D-erythro-pentofuranosid-2-ulose 2-reductase